MLIPVQSYSNNGPLVWSVICIYQKIKIEFDEKYN
jgi:hypothetical protein